MSESKEYGQLIEGGHGFAIFEKAGELTISWLTGIANIPVYRSLDLEDYEVYKNGKHTLNDLSFKASYGTWPLPAEEQEKAQKARALNRPAVLISNPKNQSLFSDDELKEILPQAEKRWIEVNGKLPDNYVSPLK